MNHDDFFSITTHHLPKNNLPLSHWIKDTEKLKTITAMEWDRMDRTYTTQDYQKKMKTIMKTPRLQPIVDVATMYEIASQFVQMEEALNIIALIAASILLFIIMVGVLNSLRMTIRERTQEIGTMRAIGMRQGGILWVFMVEALVLAILSWGAGIILAFAAIKGLKGIQFSPENPLNMLMVDRRLHFIPTWFHAIEILTLLLGFMIATVYFPARQAAKLKPAQALRQLTQ